jgi:hypothetical protein
MFHVKGSAPVGGEKHKNTRIGVVAHFDRFFEALEVQLNLQMFLSSETLTEREYLWGGGCAVTRCRGHIVMMKDLVIAFVPLGCNALPCRVSTRDPVLPRQRNFWKHEHQKFGGYTDIMTSWALQRRDATTPLQ